MASNAYALSEHFIDYPGRPPRAMPDAGVHGLHALYRLYQTEDGWIFVAAPDDRDFARLCEALGQPGLREDTRFSTRATAGRARRRARPRARRGLRSRAAPTTANASSPPRASPACRPTTVPTPRTSSTHRGPRSWVSSRRSTPGWVRTVATAASCAPSATSVPSARPTSPARRRREHPRRARLRRRRGRGVGVEGNRRHAWLTRASGVDHGGVTPVTAPRSSVA